MQTLLSAYGAINEVLLIIVNSQWIKAKRFVSGGGIYNQSLSYKVTSLALGATNLASNENKVDLKGFLY